MKNIFTTILFSSLAIALFSQPCANTANIYSFSYNGKNYEVVKEVKNWTNASACAVSRGGYLVQINDAGEQAAVYTAITFGAGVNSTYASVSDGGGIAYVWIGATDRNVEGTWLWDGNYDNVGFNFWMGQGNAGAGGGYAVASSYVNWGGTGAGAANEPDNYIGIQDCGAIGLATWPYGVAGEWNDISGANNLYYVIEYDSSFGINEHQKFHSQLYPNPANKVFNIAMENSSLQISGVKMVDQLGNLVFSQQEMNSDNISVDVSDLAEGIYFVNVYLSDGTSEYQKICVVR
ncbi:MAG: T9SS type A sorting domain-containing protein [Bacteroidetes bacterium]|nr:T9SS type A sorting domain-containing protein [Bacteroidota bacterium]